MSRRFRRVPALPSLWILVALAVAAILPAGALGAPPGAASGTVVGVQAPGDTAGVARTLAAAGLASRVLPRIHALVVPGAEADAVRRLLGSDARIRWIEPTRTRTLLAEPSSMVDQSTGRPFDWAYDAVDAGEALAMAGGGSPVRVAVVDSGVDETHPDLAGRVGPAKDIAFGQATAPDLVGHGTFVAGLISAVDGNGIGGRGVAGVTTVLPIRVTTTGSITSANAAAGIVAAVDSGARVINLSFGGPTLSAAERAALDYAAAKDVLVVAASGNSRATGNGAIYPGAAVGGVRGGWSAGVSVGAVDPVGAPAPFSTSNDAVTMSAPGAGSSEDCGDGVFSTIPQTAGTLWSDGCLRTVGALGSPTGRYGYGEGTSFAAPLVAGAAALARGVNPRLSAAQTADVLRSTARQTVSGPAWNSRTGAGVLDMGRAIEKAKRYDTVAPTPVIAAVPTPGGVAVAVTLKDPAPAGLDHSGILGVHLEASSDGVGYAGFGPDATGAVKATDSPGPGARRWYRATACDASHNCSSAVTGPVVAGALPPSSSSSSASTAPALSLVSAGRPATCRACLQVAFTAKGRGPFAWTTEVDGAGVKLVRRSGSFASARRLSVQVPLSRIPSCGGRFDIEIRLRSSSSGSQTRATRTLRVIGRCQKARSTSRRR